MSNKQNNNNDEEMVVLVDEKDIPIGAAKKNEVHSSDTSLHRGLSVFLFDERGRVLVQQRAFHKITWPGVWSNSCCGHPLPGEKYEAAAIREVREELGLEIRGLKKAADYRYRFERNGVVENEICPVFIGEVIGEVELDQSEVVAYKWMEWEEFKEKLKNDKQGKWSEWCKEEVELVEKYRQRKN